MIFIEYFFLRRETVIQLHNLRVETFNPTFVSTHHTRKQVRMKLSWASTRDRVVCQLGESRNGKKSWWIFERESENELASEQAREREREIVFRIHRTYPTFAKCVPNYATSVPPPPLESIRFFILVKRHEPLLTRFQNFVGHSPPTCPAYFEPSFLRNCTLLPPPYGTREIEPTPCWSPFSPPCFSHGRSRGQNDLCLPYRSSVSQIVSTSVRAKLGPVNL